MKGRRQESYADADADEMVLRREGWQKGDAHAQDIVLVKARVNNGGGQRGIEIGVYVRPHR